MNEKAQQVLTLVITFIGILSPNLLSLLPGSGDTGAISGQYFRNVFIVPADYAFAIWAPIYLGFLAFAVYQALPAQRGNSRFTRTRPWLMASSLLNLAWIVSFNNLLFPLSLVLIVGMLVTALVMHRTLEIGQTPVTGPERWLRVPFSLYAGWLTVATVVNASGVLAVGNWSAFGIAYPAWGVVMLVVAALIGLFTRFRWNDPVYGGVFVWALIAIVVARSETPSVALTAGLLALVFGLTLLPPVQRLLRPSGLNPSSGD
ncbi:hypothetical protein [Deinococcus sp.]|uniref:hypothetical protein n=1 Tax=Deinococcus sp. TaxID=47478 RepID=UPI003B5905C7